LIRQSGAEIGHPIDADAHCVTLQYADDTLLVLMGELGAVVRLKEILDSFAAATGLKINFSKSVLMFLAAQVKISPRITWVYLCHQPSSRFQPSIHTLTGQTSSYPLGN
jgi:hypothetical protein